MPLEGPLLGTDTVAELRARVAAALGCVRGDVSLLCGSEILADKQAVGDLPGGAKEVDITAVVSDDWVEKLRTMLVDTGACNAAGIGNVSDGVIYAMWPEDCHALYHVPRERKILQDDGVTRIPMHVDEAAVMQHLAANAKAPSEGCWVGGVKYMVTRVDTDLGSGDDGIVAVAACKERKHLHIMSTGSSFVVTFIDSTDFAVPTNKCRSAVFNFAVHMQQLGL